MNKIVLTLLMFGSLVSRADSPIQPSGETYKFDCGDGSLAQVSFTASHVDLKDVLFRLAAPGSTGPVDRRPNLYVSGKPVAFAHKNGGYLGYTDRPTNYRISLNAGSLLGQVELELPAGTAGWAVGTTKGKLQQTMLDGRLLRNTKCTLTEIW